MNHFQCLRDGIVLSRKDLERADIEIIRVMNVHQFKLNGKRNMLGYVLIEMNLKKYKVCIPMKLLNRKAPQKVIQFYESKLFFERYHGSEEKAKPIPKLNPALARQFIRLE